VNQIVFTQILQQNGLSFRIVTNGERAIDAWQRQRPSMILMDISMPEMNGYAATRLIRRAEEDEGLGARVPIIGISAHSLETERDLCINAGMDDYLAKPVSPDVLISKISQWLEHQLNEAEKARR
jgi:CheY-like chemotaxis protein